ncbi:MAG TPA: CreA family protein, partial [Dongiaceae bacterium]|nr:CreA family protein [Dongiaceae bacterium]
MLRRIALSLLMAVIAVPAMAQERIGSVSTTFHLTSPNDKVVVDRFDDPAVDGVSCYISRAETGGWK